MSKKKFRKGVRNRNVREEPRERGAHPGESKKGTRSNRSRLKVRHGDRQRKKNTQTIHLGKSSRRGV